MANNVSYIFQKKLTEKQVAMENMRASMSELNSRSPLKKLLGRLVIAMGNEITIIKTNHKKDLIR